MSGLETLAVLPRTMTDGQDAELVEAARGGDRDAFGALVVRHQRMVEAVAYAAAGDGAIVDDVVQDTFVLAWRQQGRIRKAVEADEGTSISDLHVWPVGVGQFSAVVSILAKEPRTPEYYRRIFSEHEELRHVTIEICRAEGEAEKALVKA